MEINEILNSNKLLTEIYFEIYDYFSKKYPNVVIFIEIGSFFEIYEYDNKGKAKEIANILNIQLTKKNKSIKEVNIKNPLMAGFPSQALDRYLDRLINEEKYTIVIIKQKGIPPNVKRYLAEVISPGVNLNYSKDVENYLTSIIIEKFNSYYIGFANIDLNTGKSFVYEAYSTQDDKTYALDELFRLLQTYKSKEIILTLRGVEKEEILRYLEIDDKVIINNSTRLNIHYQNELFKRVYKIDSLLTPIEVMGFERFPLITESLAILLEFIIAHNMQLIEKIKYPSLIKSDKFVYLGNNPIKQLEIDKVLKIIDKTKTAMGKRLLKERLYNPIFDKEELEKRYDLVDFMIDKIDIFSKELDNIYDLEKLNRKISILKLHVFEINFLLSSLRAASNVYTLLKKKSTFIDNFILFLENIFEEDKLTYKIDDIKDNFFKKGFNKEIDVLVEKRENYIKTLELIKTKIELLGDIKVDLNRNEKEGFYFSITKGRFKLIEDKFYDTFIDFNDKKIFFKDFNIKKLTSTIKIKGDFLEEISEKVVYLDNKISEIVKENYIEVLKIIGNKFDFLDEVAFEIAKIDVALSSAYIAKKYKYYRPIISLTKKEINKVRHPLIEINEENGIYISNDINFNEYDGMLLYGINSSGKSSLMKSVGIAIFLAQSGFFAPANMNFKLYESIFTRIEASDNLSKGLSTFAVEMLELKNILKRANSNSLILGDEIAHGTETLSALSIVAASILKLSKKQSNFIFATHLHQLMSLDEIKSLKKVVAKHLEVYFDGEKLVYNRKLQDGSGSSLYGLEFAKSIDMDKEFLEIANSIRKKITKDFSELEFLTKKKKSRYNNKLLITTCAICGRPVDDVHHIKGQDLAKEGFIDHMRVNHKYNLIPLCKEHHLKVHNQEIIITGFVTTSKGIELHFKEVNNGDKKD